MFLKALLFFVIAFCAGIVIYTFYLLASVPLTMPLLLLSLSILVISKLVSRRVTHKVKILEQRLTTATNDSELIDISGEIYQAKFPQRVFSVLVIIAALFALPHFMLGSYEQLVIFGFHVDVLSFIIVILVLTFIVNKIKTWLKQKK